MAFGDSIRSIKKFFEKNARLRRTFSAQERDYAIKELAKYKSGGISKENLRKVTRRMLDRNDPINKTEVRILREEFSKAKNDSSDPESDSPGQPELDSRDRMSALRRNVKEDPKNRLINLKKGISDRTAPPDSAPGRPSPSSRFKSNPKPGTPHR